MQFERLADGQRSAQDVAEGEIPARLAEAMGTNPDVCAWVDVPGTNVSLPVAYDRLGDERYSYGAYDGSNDTFGTLFIQRSSSPYFITPVTIIYGHAFEDVPDVMLGQLHLFEDKGFFDAHDEFHVHLSDRTLVYRIASVAMFNGINIPDYLETGGLELLQEYAELALDPCDDGLSRDVGPVDMSRDRIVQFSTCTIPATAEYRYIVTGVLVEEWRG